MLCRCGNPVNHLQTKKGTNAGRWFYTCRANKCGFFAWDYSNAADKKGAKSQQNGYSKSKSVSNNSKSDDNTKSDSNRSRNGNQSSKTNITFSIYDKSRFIVRGYHEKLIEFWRSIPKSSWNPSNKGWVIPFEDYESSLKNLKMQKNLNIEINEFPPYVVKLFGSGVDADERYKQTEIETQRKIRRELWESLLPYQKEGVVRSVMRNGRILLGDEMGLGKTVQALAVCSFYRGDWPVLVVCPATLRTNWQNEINKWLDETNVQTVFHAADSVSVPTPHFVVISYDLCLRLDEHLRDRFRIIICDEAHQLKNKDSQRSKLLIPLIQKTKRALLLTGTPAISRPVELFPQLTALEKNVFPAFRQYGARYCNGYKGPFGWDYTGSSNLEELNWMLEQTVLIRRIKKDVELELPTKGRQLVCIEIDETFKREFKKLKGSSESLRQQIVTASGLQQKRLVRQKETLMTKMYLFTGTAKIPPVIEYLTTLYKETTKKFLVYAHHLSILDAIEEALTTELKADVIRIDGSTAAQHRQALCDTFQTDPRIRVGILSLTAASAGITLTAADMVIFAELYWNPSCLLQAEDRAHRIGRDAHVDVKYLIAKDTADEILWPLIQDKLRVVGKMLDNDFMKVSLKEGTSFGKRDPLLTDYEWLAGLEKYEIGGGKVESESGSRDDSGIVIEDNYYEVITEDTNGCNKIDTSYYDNVFIEDSDECDNRDDSVNAIKTSNEYDKRNDDMDVVEHSHAYSSSMNDGVNVIVDDNGNANKEDDVWGVGKDETICGDGSMGMVHLRSRPLVFGDIR
ncbi:11800_t:CDS:2 [Paraglomus brasilianum]|uniref:11800_t:CDS:1 n=1 Tax=Paraglomus brasilianum TaxID=144538 RepID=A0A9N9CBG2_9GLOM|nr:11800_t:CDS:2 [Paraglomus brasilianum]